MLKPLTLLTIVCAASSSHAVRASEAPVTVEISAEKLEDKIRGGLLGQILGNLNGLPHEMKYIGEPGNVEHYTPGLPEGAWTDDDTDLEWVYVVGMEKSGKVLLPAEEISKLWQRHINQRIWCANEYARQLMWIRIDPPLTGRFAINPWSDFNISGQFICESFALIAPAMPQTAGKIGLNYTRVTIEGEPAQTTQLFTAMIATAFVEEDLNKILDAGVAAIDPKSEIHQIVLDVRRWYAEHPDDWRRTRALVKGKYSRHNGEMRDRNGYELNTASTIAALLYGRGDFVETLRTAFNFGWDADNNAATSATIIGVIRGRKWIDQQGWNIKDVYKNTSRDDMPVDESITSFGARLVRLARQVILENGGEEFTRNGQRYYRIRRQQPENIEKLTSFDAERRNLQSAMRPEIHRDLSSEDVRMRARAAYLAIVLDEASGLAASRPQEWKRALEALKQFGQVGDVLFRTPTPAGEMLKVKARAAGLEPRQAKESATSRAILRDAPPLDLPGVTVPAVNQYHGFDCNNPVHWDGATMYVFSSTAQPWRTYGPDMFHLKDPSIETKFDNDEGWHGGRWIESTYKDESGLLYGWYHHEQVGICPPKKTTAPQIGAVVSKDNGLQWHDLGIILTMAPNSLNCESVNDAFSGGNGDFSVILDHAKEFFYVFFGNYHREMDQQGVCVARFRYADRDAPVGKVTKWHDGRFGEPGLGGKVTPFFRNFVDIHREDANYFWGPAIHWNTHLKQYVILLNRAKNAKWNQEGVYVTFNPRLDDPLNWTRPVKILEGVHYYPQVIGTDTSKRETDKLAGRTARLFVTGKSRWEITFLRPGETDTQPQ